MTKPNCRTCGGCGAMTLYAGPGPTLLAPCLECSPTRRLADIEADLGGKFQRSGDDWKLVKDAPDACDEFERDTKMLEIEGHNERMASLSFQVTPDE